MVKPLPLSRAAVVFGIAALFGGASGCRGPAPPAAYRPRLRPVTVTAVPLLTKEMRRIYPFLAHDFARGGVLEGKEVYAFEPSTITAVEGDTLALTLINPEDDAHSFVLPGLEVGMPPESAVTARYVAAAAGIYTYTCSIPTHLPFMYGTLVVLAPSGLRTP